MMFHMSRWLQKKHCSSPVAVIARAPMATLFRRSHADEPATFRNIGTFTAPSICSMLYWYSGRLQPRSTLGVC